MAGIDTSISNGTCYWTADNKMKQDFIPCGNAYKQDVVFSCCGVGDFCFDQGACYHEDDAKWYVAGCTDPNYEDAACHDKDKYVTQTLMLLTPCGDDAGNDDGNNNTDDDGDDGGDGGNGDSDNEIMFAGCRASAGNRPSTACTCGANNPPLLTLSNPPAPTASLPGQLGGSIVFFTTQDQTTESTTAAPSTTSTAATTPGSPKSPPINTATATSALSSPTTTLHAPATTPPQTSLPPGKIAGIASGVGIVVLIMIVVGSRWCHARQHDEERQKRRWPPLNPRTPRQPDSSDPTGTALPPIVEMPESPQTIPPRPNRPSDSDELHINRPAMSTMPPSPSVTPLVQYRPALISPRSPPPPRAFEAYSPEKHGDYSRYSSSHYSNDSPQHQPQHSSYGSTQSSNAHNARSQHNGHGLAQTNDAQLADAQDTHASQDHQTAGNQHWVDIHELA